MEQLLTELRAIIDEREQLAEQDRKLSARKAQIERDIQRFSETHGVNKFSGGGLSVSVQDKLRVTYVPEEWPNFLRWAIETGNDHLIQRRITENKVLDLMASGTVVPAELVKTEAYRKVSIRRSA